MVYVLRDGSSNIIGIYNNNPPQGVTEQLDINDPAVAAFLAPPPNVIPFPVFIGRWTPAEYQSVMQKRAQVINAAGTANMFLVMQWDQAMSAGIVDLGSSASQTFKANLVSSGTLTQARADAIFT